MPERRVGNRRNTGPADLYTQKFFLDEALDGPRVARIISDQRILWMRHREEVLAFQKDCASRKDIEGARFFKEEAAHAMKHYRAACLLLPQVQNEVPGDCKFRDPYEFPPELWGALTYIESLAVAMA